MTVSRRALVFDTTCLSHFALAERLDVLRDLVVEYDCRTTHVVREELRRGGERHALLIDAPELEWLEVIALDSLGELARFIEWAKRLGAGDRNLGESSVCAAAEINAAIAIIDDGDACRVARRHGLEVHGTIWLLASACRTGKLTVTACGNIVDALRDTGMRLPCTGREFGDYAHRHGLL
jgi:predicted nucleic acid-binding protein